MKPKRKNKHETVTNAFVCVLALALSTGFASGCVTARFDRVPGMVYDSSGKPVIGAEILLDGHIVTVSDVNGRFAIPWEVQVKEGDAAYEIARVGYETKEIPLDRSAPPGPGTAVYVLLESRDDFVRRAWEAIGERRFTDSSVLLERAAAVEAPGPDWAVTALANLVLDPDSPPQASRDMLAAIRRGAYGEVPPAWIAPFTRQ